MYPINEKQKAIFEFIKEEIDENGVAPSVREIGAAVGLKSTSTVQYNLNALEEAGYIEREPNLKRTIRVTNLGSKTSNIPLIGTVTAGIPITAVEYIEDYITAPISKNGRELFALKVRGDSMINAAILSGDIIIVERTPDADNGEIVVAMIDDEATVKRFYREKGHFRLQPENDDYEPIIADRVDILGRVITVIRNY